MVVTDRVELDDQIAKTFKATGAVSEARRRPVSRRKAARHLRELLRGNHRYVFTLIHKFQTPEMLLRPARRDCAHGRSAPQPIRHTGAEHARGFAPGVVSRLYRHPAHRRRRTDQGRVRRLRFHLRLPAIRGGRRDRAAFYENRTPELQLVNPDLNEEIYTLIEAAELDPEDTGSEAQTGVEPAISHSHARRPAGNGCAGHRAAISLGAASVGKAMVVSIDKATALKMHDKVRKHWAAERDRVRRELEPLTKLTASDRIRAELQGRLQVLNTTDMALIVSPGQNEVEQMRKHGLDIVPHRQRMNDSQPPLDERFKDPDDPLRLVFVCAMWLTGFDAPSCSTVYLDKPMRNHTLMQTIARANRVFPVSTAA